PPLRKEKMRLDRSPCRYWARSRLLHANPRNDYSTLSSTENPGISLTTGDPPPVRPLEQRNQVLACQAQAVAKLGWRRSAELSERIFDRSTELVQCLFQGVPLLIDPLD